MKKALLVFMAFILAVLTSCGKHESGSGTESTAAENSRTQESTVDVKNVSGTESTVTESSSASKGTVTAWEYERQHEVYRRMSSSGSYDYESTSKVTKCVYELTDKNDNDKYSDVLMEIVTIEENKCLVRVYVNDMLCWEFENDDFDADCFRYGIAGAGVKYIDITGDGIKDIVCSIREVRGTGPLPVHYYIYDVKEEREIKLFQEDGCLADEVLAELEQYADDEFYKDFPEVTDFVQYCAMNGEIVVNEHGQLCYESRIKKSLEFYEYGLSLGSMCIVFSYNKEDGCLHIDDVIYERTAPREIGAAEETADAERISRQLNHDEYHYMNYYANSSDYEWNFRCTEYIYEMTYKGDHVLMEITTIEENKCLVKVYVNDVLCCEFEDDRFDVEDFSEPGEPAAEAGVEYMDITGDGSGDIICRIGELSKTKSISSVRYYIYDVKEGREIGLFQEDGYLADEILAELEQYIDEEFYRDFPEVGDFRTYCTGNGMLRADERGRLYYESVIRKRLDIEEYWGNPGKLLTFLSYNKEDGHFHVDGIMYDRTALLKDDANGEEANPKENGRTREYRQKSRNEAYERFISNLEALSGWDSESTDATGYVNGLLKENGALTDELSAELEQCVGEAFYEVFPEVTDFINNCTQNGRLLMDREGQWYCETPVMHGDERIGSLLTFFHIEKDGRCNVWTAMYNRTDIYD